jgi:hypothetical protein
LTKSRRRTGQTRKTSASRRAPARKAATRRSPKLVRMKPLYEQLGRTIDQLQKLPASDRVKFAIARLTQCREDFEDICGPTMDVPADPLPTA